jgi:hypothetical protein
LAKALNALTQRVDENRIFREQGGNRINIPRVDKPLELQNNVHGVCRVHGVSFAFVILDPSG